VSTFRRISIRERALFFRREGPVWRVGWGVRCSHTSPIPPCNRATPQHPQDLDGSGRSRTSTNSLRCLKGCGCAGFEG
jgi:hypothetical protein